MSVPRDMEITLIMDGFVNGHYFMIDGKGKGKPFEGTHTIDLTVKEGGPLPFAYDILTTAFQYGNRAFTKYPPGIPDYFKETCPPGFFWERTMTFEDGGTCTVSNDIKMDGNSFNYKIRFDGVNFPPNGPVMQKKTQRWEPSTENMYVRNGVLQGDAFRYLLLEDGSHYRCDFRTTYTAKKKGVKLPLFHFVDHRIEILSQKNDYNEVTVHENAVARHSMLPIQAK